MHRREIAHRAAQLGVRIVLGDARNGFVDTRLRAPVHDHRRALACERACDREADAERGAANERGFPVELQIHG